MFSIHLFLRFNTKQKIPVITQGIIAKPAHCGIKDIFKKLFIVRFKISINPEISKRNIAISLRIRFCLLWYIKKSIQNRDSPMVIGIDNSQKKVVLSIRKSIIHWSPNSETASNIMHKYIFGFLNINGRIYTQKVQIPPQRTYSDHVILLCTSISLSIEMKMGIISSSVTRSAKNFLSILFIAVSTWLE